MAIHPCTSWQEHVAVALAAGEADRPADFLDRFEEEREEEERLAAREQATAESELELRYAYGDV